MKFNFDLLIGIGLSIMMLGVLILSVILVLSHFTPKDLCNSWCDQNKGTYWLMTDCNGDTIACSGWCELPNKTKYCKDILNNIIDVIN